MKTMSYGNQSDSYTINNIYYGSDRANRAIPSAPPPPYTQYQDHYYTAAPIQTPSYIHGTENTISHTYNGQIQHRISNHYPAKYAAIHGVLLILFGLAMIGLNVAMLIYKPDMFMVPTGFIGGAYFLILAFFTLLISKELFLNKKTNLIPFFNIVQKRSFNLYYTMHLLYQLELIFFTPFVLVISILSAAGFRCDKLSGRVCSPYNIKLHVPIAAIGGFGSLLCLIFLIVLLQKIGTMKYARCQIGPSN